MFDITINEEKNNVIFYREGEEFYSIINHNLSQTREKDGLILSEWIEQLNGRNWVTPELLYKLASIITKKYPDNSIDWYITFLGVENETMLKHVYKKQTVDEEQDQFPLKSQITVHKEVLDYITFARDFDRSAINPMLEQLVVEKLKQYNIVN